MLAFMLFRIWPFQKTSSSSEFLHTLELNPAEKVWQWMKERVVMKFFEDVVALQTKIAQMINNLNPKLIKSITEYELYTKNLYE